MSTSLDDFDYDVSQGSSPWIRPVASGDVIVYYSTIPRFRLEGLPKILHFVYFVLIWWLSDKIQ